MTLDSVAFYLHIVGSMAMFIGVATDWIIVNRVRQAKTLDQLSQWLSLTAGVRLFGPASLGLTLVTGYYLVFAHGSYTAWIGLTVTAILLLGGLGAYSGIRLASIGKQLSGRTGQLSQEDALRLNNPLFLASVQTRVAILLAIVFLMTNKPALGGSVLAVLGACVLGLGSALPAWLRSIHADKMVPGNGSRG
jgi:hypothetical protein